MSRILDGINEEVKQPYVEISMQALSEQKDKSIKETLEKFSREKNRVVKGTKEAKWNNKYMKIIEKPVIQVEKATNFRDIQFVIASLLKSLKNIYDNSNFYKEARIVSFVDRLMECIMGKVKQQSSLNISILRGKKDYEQYT